MYPYDHNNYKSRTHREFVATARQVAMNLSSGQKHSNSINGIKGMSSMLQLFRYPVDIVFDYMHLICLNHGPSLIKRFVAMFSKLSIADIDDVLFKLRLPHDVNIKYDFSIRLVNDWKAKQVRLFLLNIGLPILAPYLSRSILSHFAVYCTFVKLVHCPKDKEEIKLADRLIHYYCKNAPRVYDLKIELYSLHAHLHLPSQVQSNQTEYFRKKNFFI